MIFIYNIIDIDIYIDEGLRVVSEEEESSQSGKD